MSYVKIDLEEYLKTKALADLNKSAIEAVVKETLDNTIKDVLTNVNIAIRASNQTKLLAMRINLVNLEKIQNHKEMLGEDLI